MATTGIARFNGSITNTDLTAARTYTLPDATGTFAVSASAPLSLNTTTGNLTLGTVGVANGGTGLTGTPTNGQLPIGNGSGYTLATLTAGSGVSVTNAAGSITIANTGVLAEADTLASVTGRGNTTTTTISDYGETITSGTAANDQILLSITTTGLARFNGTITNTDLTAARTYTLPDATGTFAVSASAPLSLNATTGNLTLGTVGVANGGTGLTATPEQAQAVIADARKKWPNDSAVEMAEFSFQYRYGDPRVAERLIPRVLDYSDAQLMPYRKLVTARLDPSATKGLTFSPRQC